MCKLFIHRGIINKEAILQTLPSFKRILMGKLVKLMNKSSLATFSGMLGTSSLSVPLKRRVARRRKTKKIRRRPTSLLYKQIRTNRIKKREKQRREGSVRHSMTLTTATMATVAIIAVMEPGMAMEMVLEMVPNGERTLQTSIIIRRRRERGGQRGRISRLTHKALNLGVETVDVHPHLAPHQTLALIQELIFLKKLTKSTQSPMKLIMLTIKMVKILMQILIIKSIMMITMTNSKLTYIQINTKRTMGLTTTAMPMKIQALAAMATIIAMPIIMEMRMATLEIKTMEEMIALMIEMVETVEILILMLTIMVLAMDM